MHRSRWLILLLAVVAQVLPSLMGPGVILCFEADGNVVLERSDDLCCDETPPSAAGSLAQGDCCVDVSVGPVLGDEPPRHPGYRLAVDLVAAPLLPVAIEPAPARGPCLPAWRVPLEPPLLAQLRTVVLRC